jgi:hypothetical protein
MKYFIKIFFCLCLLVLLPLHGKAQTDIEKQIRLSATDAVNLFFTSCVTNRRKTLEQFRNWADENYFVMYGVKFREYSDYSFNNGYLWSPKKYVPNVLFAKSRDNKYCKVSGNLTNTGELPDMVLNMIESNKDLFKDPWNDSKVVIDKLDLRDDSSGIVKEYYVYAEDSLGESKVAVHIFPSKKENSYINFAIYLQTGMDKSRIDARTGSGPRVEDPDIYDEILRYR